MLTPETDMSRVAAPTKDKTPRPTWQWLRNKGHALQRQMLCSPHSGHGVCTVKWQMTLGCPSEHERGHGGALWSGPGWCQVPRWNPRYYLYLGIAQCSKSAAFGFPLPTLGPKDPISPTASVCVCVFIFFSFYFWFLRQAFYVAFGTCHGTRSCRPDCPQTHRDPPASASWVLGLYACATTARQCDHFLYD